MQSLRQLKGSGGAVFIFIVAYKRILEDEQNRKDCPVYQSTRVVRFASRIHDTFKTLGLPSGRFSEGPDRATHRRPPAVAAQHNGSLARPGDEVV